MIQNKVNNKIYIGQTLDIDARWKAHKNALRNNKHGNDYLQKSWNKYGEDNFEFKVLQECDEEDLNIFETLYINILKTLAPDGYNLVEGGSSKKPSEKIRQKISKACKGKKRSLETRQKMSENHADFSGKKNPMYGKPFSKEHKQNLSEAQHGEKNHQWIPITEEMIFDYRNGIKRKDFIIKYKVSKHIWYKIKNVIKNGGNIKCL
jgi:group I intron endonuclease